MEVDKTRFIPNSTLYLFLCLFFFFLWRVQTGQQTVHHTEQNS